MDVPSKLSGVSHKNPEDYSTLHDIVSEVEFLTHENFILTQATDVLERYLRKKSPNTLVGLDKGLENVGLRDSLMTRQSMNISTSHESASLATQHTSTSSSPALTSRSALHSSVGPYKVNIVYRLEMVERELEDGKMTMDKLRKRFESAKFILETEEENFRNDFQVLDENEKALEIFIAENTDQKTGRLFQDKILRYLEAELNAADRELRKMKLKTKTYQTEYGRMKSQQQQKLELRERLHPIDLEKLRIENQGLLELLEQNTKELLDNKKAVGKKGQSMVLAKSNLNDTMIALKNYSQDIKVKEAKYAFTEVKESQNLNDLMAAEALNQSMKKLNSTYKSPDVHTYLMMEVKIEELRREREIWDRRCRNQKQTLDLLEHQLKQLAPGDSRSRSFRTTNKSIRSTRSGIGSKSADWLRQQSRDSIPFPHCTPTTPYNH